MCLLPLSLFHADGDVHGMTLESTGSSLSQVTLLSTLYFRSMWQKKFSLMDSQMLPFTTPEGSTLNVPTMHHTAEVNYGNCPWSIFDLLCNMEQIYLISTDTTVRCVVSPALRSLRRSPIKWRDYPGDQIGPQFQAIMKEILGSEWFLKYLLSVPSLTDQHLPVLHDKLVSCRKQQKGTNMSCQEKERKEKDERLRVLQYTKSFTIAWSWLNKAG